jgi:hypothetical protein
MATTPLGLAARNISAATSSGRGANMAPKTDATTSKASANGSASASASSHVTSTPSARARAAELYHARGHIRGGHLGAHPGCGKGEVAVAGGNVEDLHARHYAGGGEVLGRGFEEGGEAAVVTLRPEPLRALLDARQRIGGWMRAQP